MTRKVNTIEGDVGAGATIIQVATGPTQRLSPKIFPEIGDISPDKPAWYLFFNRKIALLGRESELHFLSELCDRDENFLFAHIYGPGGIGKSRLGLEFVESQRSIGWHGGFLNENDISIEAFSSWEPDQPTIWIADYCSRYLHRIPNLITVLAALSKNWKFPVRLLFLERFNVYEVIASRAETSAYFYDVENHFASFSKPLSLAPLQSSAKKLFLSCLSQFSLPKGHAQHVPEEELILSITDNGNPLLVAFAAAQHFVDPQSLKGAGFNRSQLLLSFVDREIAYLRTAIENRRLLDDTIILLALSSLVGGLLFIRPRDFVAVRSDEKILLIKSNWDGIRSDSILPPDEEKYRFPTFAEVSDIYPVVGESLEEQNRAFASHISLRLSITDPLKIIDRLRFNPTYENLNWQMQPDIVAEALVAALILGGTVRREAEITPYLADQQILSLVNLAYEIKYSDGKGTSPTDFFLRMQGGDLSKVLSRFLMRDEFERFRFSELVGSIVEKRNDALQILPFRNVRTKKSSFRTSLLDLAETFLRQSSSANPEQLKDLEQRVRSCYARTRAKSEMSGFLLAVSCMLSRTGADSNVKMLLLQNVVTHKNFSKLCFSFPASSLMVAGCFDKILRDPLFQFNLDAARTVMIAIEQVLLAFHGRSDLPDGRRSHFTKSALNKLANICFSVFRRPDDEVEIAAAAIAPTIRKLIDIIPVESVLLEADNLANDILNFTAVVLTAGNWDDAHHLISIASRTVGLSEAHPYVFKLLLDVIRFSAEKNNLEFAINTLHQLPFPKLKVGYFFDKDLDIPEQFGFVISSLLDCADGPNKAIIFRCLLEASEQTDIFDDRASFLCSGLLTLGANLLYVDGDSVIKTIEKMVSDRSVNRSTDFQGFLNFLLVNRSALQELALQGGGRSLQFVPADSKQKMS
jgi:hypothetical protein